MQDAPELPAQMFTLLYVGDVVLILAGLQHALHVLQVFYGEKLLSVNMSKMQVVISNDPRHPHSNMFLYGWSQHICGHCSAHVRLFQSNN